MLKKLLLFAALAAVLPAKEPRPLPQVLISTTSGVPINLQKYHGKVMVIAIISTTCEDCVQAAQMLNRLQKDYAGRPFQPIAVVGDPDGRGTVNPFVQRYRLTYPVGFLETNDIIKLANITTERPVAPILLFVDKTGTVRSQYFGDDQFFKNAELATRNTINALLRQK